MRAIITYSRIRYQMGTNVSRGLIPNHSPKREGQATPNYTYLSCMCIHIPTLHAHACANVYLCAYVHTPILHACAHVHLPFTHMCIHVHTPTLHACLYVHLPFMCVHMYTYLPSCKCIHTLTLHTCLYVHLPFTCVCMCMCTSTLGVDCSSGTPALFMYKSVLDLFLSYVHFPYSRKAVVTLYTSTYSICIYRLPIRACWYCPYVHVGTPYTIVLLASHLYHAH